MPELSVVIVAVDNEQRTVLQVLVDGTSVARTIHTCASFPVAAAHPVMRRVQSANPEVLLVDIPGDNAATAMRAIELLHQELPECAVFAIGNLDHCPAPGSERRPARQGIHCRECQRWERGYYRRRQPGSCTAGSAWANRS